MAYIKLENVSVVGVNTQERATSLKHLFVGQKKITGIEIPILTNINFEAKAGDRIGIIGRNGCGKSSLLKIISGIYPATKGIRTVIGTIAPLIEMGAGFDPEISGRKNIKLNYAYRGKLEQYSQSLEQEIIEFAELQDKIDLPLKTYSSGMQQRLAFSCTIFQQPNILLLDEIFSAGDIGFLQKSRRAIEQKWHQADIAIIVSHSNQDIKNLCNRCILIDQGEIIAESNSEEIIELYQEKIFSTKNKDR